MSSDKVTAGQTPEPNTLDIEVNVRLLNEPQGKLIGLASVSYGGFVMDNFKLFNGENGLFLGEPSIRNERGGGFRKTVRITDDTLKATLNSKALDGYNAAIEQLEARASAARKIEVRPSIPQQLADGAVQAEKDNAARPDPSKPPKGKDDR